MEQDGNLRKKSVLIRWQRGQTALEAPVISRDEKEMSCRQRYVLACIVRDTFEELCFRDTTLSKHWIPRLREVSIHRWLSSRPFKIN